MVYVAWDEAVAFRVWLSQATGSKFRLPTEAEWEKTSSWDAGRQKKRRYPWGDEFDAARCNTVEFGLGETTPLGKYSPTGDSPYIEADMAGNVWQWCSLYRDYPYNERPARPGKEGRRGCCKVRIP